MSSETQWFRKNLGEVTCNHDGKRKPVKESERKKGPFPYYGASGIVDYVDDYLFDGRYLLIAEDGENLRTRQTPIAFIADGKFWVNNHAHIVTGNGEVTTEYLHYFLQHADIQPYLTGAVMPKLTQANLNRIPVRYPDADCQRQIVRVLSVLDRKIDLNRRINQTLEAMAQAIFKSWFIDFDPVKAKIAAIEQGEDPLRAAMCAISGLSACGAQAGKTDAELDQMPREHHDQLAATAALFPDAMEESELGEIPKGWQIGSVDDLCISITSGGTPSRKNAAYWENGIIPWFKTGELHDGPLMDSEEHITEAALEGSSAKLWPAGTILFALYASPTVGRLGVLTQPSTSNQAAAGLVAKQEYGVPFLRRVLLDAREKLQNIAVGAAQQNINQGILKSHQVIVPPFELATAYSKHVAGMDEQQTLLATQSRTLAQLRDTLLPKLLSGELSVADVEIPA